MRRLTGMSDISKYSEDVFECQGKEWNQVKIYGIETLIKLLKYDLKSG
jgi:hypothetical protein